MASHLDKDPPTDDSKKRWMEDDARLFLQIRNSIDNKILTLNQCEFPKELMDYLEFVYSSKGNNSHIFVVCREPFIALRNKNGLLRNFSRTINRHMKN